MHVKNLCQYSLLILETQQGPNLPHFLQNMKYICSAACFQQTFALNFHICLNNRAFICVITTETGLLTAKKEGGKKKKKRSVAHARHGAQLVGSSLSAGKGVAQAGNNDSNSANARCHHEIICITNNKKSTSGVTWGVRQLTRHYRRTRYIEIMRIIQCEGANISSTAPNMYTRGGTS